MALRVKVSGRTASHIRMAAEWWQANRPAAPRAVGKDIGEAFALLARQPGIGAAYEGAKTKDVRRLLAGRIRYYIYDRVTPDAVDVLAVWHGSRGKQPTV